MSAAAALSPTPILIERRFPLDLHATSVPIRQLYEDAKVGRWNPQSDIDWKAFDPAGFDAATLAAAARLWSRRAWTEYTGLAETPALLIRFCLERDREADPKYFLSVRNTEEAWHVEVFHQYATLCGGYAERPANPAWETVFNRNFERDALDASRSLDAYVAIHCAFVDGLEHALAARWLDNAREPVARGLLARCVADYERHQRFGWLYLERRLAGAGADQADAIAQGLATHLRDVEFAGYHCASLATAIDARPEAEDAARVAAAGLGGLDAAAETAVFVDYLAASRTRLARMGVSLPTVAHPELGAL